VRTNSSCRRLKARPVLLFFRSSVENPARLVKRHGVGFELIQT
jgi:hypothetical protein